jgi:ribonuclease T2
MSRNFSTGVIALLVFAYLAAAGTAPARHRSHAGAGVPGEFAYYLLALSWSPAFCLSSPGAAECNGPRRYGFIVHGLWPQNEQGWPENCAVHDSVPDEVVRGIEDLMPARGLVYHEWSAHGTCSGLEPAAFFALVRRAYSEIAIPAELSNPAEASEQSPRRSARHFSMPIAALRRSRWSSLAPGGEFRGCAKYMCVSAAI